MISVLRVKCLRDDVICPKSKQEEREELGAEEAQVLTMTPTPTDALILAHLECRVAQQIQEGRGNNPVVHNMQTIPRDSFPTGTESKNQRDRKKICFPFMPTLAVLGNMNN